MIVLGLTAKPVTASFAPLAIGLALIHLVNTPVTNTSINPARSTGVALFQGGAALQQLWVFWLVPLVAGAPAVCCIGWCWRRGASSEGAAIS
ncbi:aquaporin [Luteimonas sp. RC10]|uniref:aquaporin n=1 Tax=Luteimonas sp. RC10 TaxID=2587035 RepID=UPI001794B2E3|nr:aquaporin [Luteimonas sp. RC10]MBB3345181.1 glycerol uptake facilitator-like aquaporin [Luteimonas sp. RC10]